MSSRTTTNAMSLYNNKNDGQHIMMSNFNSRSTPRHPSFVATAAAAARTAEENTNTSGAGGANMITSSASNSSCNHDVSSVRSTNSSTTSRSQELSSSSAAVANNPRGVPPGRVADDLDEEDANQGANDLLMTAATALASFSSSQILVRGESTPRRDHDGGPHQFIPITTGSTNTTPRTKTTGGGTTTRSVRLQHHHHDHPSSTSSTNTGDDSSPPPPLQQQLPLLLSSSRHDHGATRPTNHAAYELLDGGWQEHDYVRGSHYHRGGCDDFAIIKEHLPNKAQSKQKAKRFPVKLMHMLSSGIHDHIICWTPDGLSFVVRKPNLLVSEVLPNYFKEVKYSSFTRKLHRWGFAKILRGKELSAYFHKDFRRGDYERCAQMTCSKNGIGNGGLDVMSHVMLQKNLAPARKIQEQIQQEKEQILQEQMMQERYAQDYMISRNNSTSRFVESPDMVDHRFQQSHSAVFLPPQPSYPVHHGEHISSSTASNPYLHQHQQMLIGYPRLPNAAFSGANFRICGGSGSFFSLPTTMEDLQFEKARHALEHRRIIDNAMNALKWEQARTGRGSHSYSQSNLPISHLSSAS